MKKSRIQRNNTLAKQERLIGSNNEIISELREIKWLYNPVVYSQISGDFTLMQQRILIGIIERLQRRIVESVAEQHRDKSFLSIFDESELMNKETIDITIPANDLGVIPAHYDQLEQAAIALNKITMKYPKYNKNGRVARHVVATLFPRIEITMNESELRRTGMLRVVMLTDNIRDIFTMQHGFVRHVSHIARIAQKKRTPRLYIYLSRFKDVGKKKVSYSDLIEYLGLTDEYYYETNNGKNPFSSWAKVKQLVLDPVKKEMDELAEKGEINFTFDYEPVFPEGKTRGIPNEVLFIIRRSQMGEEKQKGDNRKNSIYNFVEKMTGWCSELSTTSLKSIAEDLDNETLSELVNFALNELRMIVERKQPDNVAYYVMGVLKKWKREKLKNTNHSTLTSFSNMENGNKNNSNSIEQDVIVIGEYAKEWESVLNQYEGKLKESLLLAKHIGSCRGFVYIEFESKAKLDEYNRLEAELPAERIKLTKMLTQQLGNAGRIIVKDYKK